MAPPTPGLTTADIDQIRAGVAEGRKPKVVFTDAAGQIAGQVGQVVALTDPDDSDEWIVVHFGRDELPFSPSDLAIPVRANANKASKTDRTGKTATTAAPDRAATSTAAPDRAATSTAAPDRAATSTAAPDRAATSTAVAARTTPRRATTAKAPDPEPDPPAAPVPAQREGQRQERKAMPTTGAPTVEAAAAPGKDSAAQTLNGTSPNGTSPHAATANGAGPVKLAKAAKPKPPASLVVTLQYAEKEWTVAATQGSKSLAKPYVIKPSEALRMVALIDVPGVHEAVEAIIASERAEAEGRALRLREELAEIESRLAELNHG